MNKIKKAMTVGLSILAMLTNSLSVFAAEPDNKTTTLNYQVSPSYDWIIHSAIDFGADAGPNKTVERTGNQVKVLKNVIPEGKYLNISVKGSGADDAFTVDNGGSEVLNYDVSDDNGAVGVNGNVLSVPAGTNTATQNMNFKLNTKKGSAEVAGVYNGRVIYNASVGDKNGGTTSGTAESYSAGDTLDIEGTKYVVLEQKENNQALVMTASSVVYKEFQSDDRSDGQNQNTYEGSEIDNYLENDWYNSLSSTMKAAIQTTNIKQASYATYNDPDSKQETGYNGQVYNTISRHVFLPGADEIGKVVDLKNPDKVKAFLNHTSIWTRDSLHSNDVSAEFLTTEHGSLFDVVVYGACHVRPAFVVDLSQVNYSVVIKGSTSGGTSGSGDSESSGGTVTTPSELKALDIEGIKYVVLEERENNQALVLTADSIGNKSFSRGYRDDVKQNTYEGSMIDRHLENEWYNGLSSTMKAAIQTTNIKQASYAIDTDPDSKQETGTNGQVYNTISRHVFLPSVSEIGKVVDLKDPDKVKAFLKGISIWTRDSNQSIASDAECLYANDGRLYGYKVRNAIGVRPAFVIDLSQVNYSVVK